MRALALASFRKQYNMSIVLKKTIAVVLGAAIGYAIGHYGRCFGGGGGWGMTSNPWSGMLMGALLGYTLVP